MDMMRRGEKCDYLLCKLYCHSVEKTRVEMNE
jgi:hypothetical protein